MIALSVVKLYVLTIAYRFFIKSHDDNFWLKVLVKTGNW